MRTRHLFFAVLVFAAACSGEPRDGDIPARLYAPSTYDSVPRLRLVAAAPLCNTADIECAVDGGALAVDDSGTVAFAGIFRDRQIRLVAAKGDTVRVISRQGSGPGEHQTVVALGFSPSGSVRAFDIMQHRVLELTRDGRTASTSTVPVPPGFIDADFANGQLRIIATEVGRRSGDSAAVAIYAADSGKRRARRLFTLGVRQRSYAMTDLVPIKPPFEAAPRFAIRRDGAIVYTGGAAFVINVLDSAGRHVDRFGFDTPRRKVTPADLERWQTRSVRGLPSYMQAAIRGSGTHPAPYHPAITQLRSIGEALWVREASRGDSVRWIRFDRGGEPAGMLLLGEAASIVGGHKDAIIISEPTAQKGRRSLRWFSVTPPRTAAAPSHTSASRSGAPARQE